MTKHVSPESQSSDQSPDSSDASQDASPGPNAPSSHSLTSTANITSNDSKSSSVLLSSITPIVNVPIQPLHVKTPQKLLHLQNHAVHYTWSRSSTKFVCQTCGKDPHVQCLECEACFCEDTNCFLTSQHKNVHLNQYASKQTSQKMNRSESMDLLEPTMSQETEDSSTITKFIQKAHKYGRNYVTTFEPIAYGRTYCPTNDDLHRLLQLKVEICDSEFIQSAVLFESKPVQPFPNRLMRAFLDHPNISTKELMGFQFTIMSYNVLAEMYATKSMFPHIAPHFLDFNFRKLNILREILHYMPDIICLQEVQDDHFRTFWYVELSKHGYDGFFKKKTKDIFTGKYTMDGCATLFKRSVFDAVDTKETEFRKLAIDQIRKHQSWTRMIKDNVALAVILRPKMEIWQPLYQEYYRKHGQYSGTLFDPNPPLICVGNTHIMANPQYTDVKIWQVYAYLQELYKFTNNGEIPLLLVGDFNSLPDSGAYNLLTEQYLPNDHPDLQHPSHHHSNILDEIHWSHPLQLTSAYGYYNNNGEPNFTTKTPSFCGTLDYIFFTATGARKSLRATKILSLPEVGIEEYLPNQTFPSDHFSLMASFELSIQ